ncbi:hypothetical protein ID866_2166 [Astraeus odoratus]|nr:hypothetical protein ID866_2166 [Astraeus odoratus]
MATKPYNGQEAEVIATFHDGYSYSKNKMDASLRELVPLDRKPTKPVKEPTNAKREDVDVIVNEFEISRLQAEKLLTEHGGDLTKALRALVNS